MSTGLDSATITDAVTLFRTATDVFKSTAIVSLLQPPPEASFCLSIKRGPTPASHPSVTASALDFDIVGLMVWVGV